MVCSLLQKREIASLSNLGTFSQILMLRKDNPGVTESPVDCLLHEVYKILVLL